MKLDKSNVYFLVLAILLIGLLFACSETADPNESRLAKIHLDKVVGNGKPTLAEFGWRECVPCKAMRPILEELDELYKGKLNVVIVEIPFNEDLAEKYNIRVMPVQIYFDSSGKEVNRHAGFLPMEEIIVQLKKMGI